MAVKKFSGAILILILAAIACSGGKGEPNVQETVDAAVQATQAELDGNDSTKTPSLTVSTPISATPTIDTQSNPVIDEQTPCEASKWEIHAISKSEQPSGAGLKLVFVQFAIKNGSSRGGVLSTSEPVATTEGGFSYPGKLVSGIQGFSSSTTPNLVPPGFIINGGAWGNNPQLYEPLVWSFEVAETQKKLSIAFPGFVLNCYSSTGEFVNELFYDPVVVDVDKDISQTLNFAAQLENLKSIEDGIDIKNLGQLDFVSATREGEILTVKFKFTNASAGYKTAGYIHTYLIDNEGAVLQPEGGFASGAFEAGPGQSTEVEFRYVIAKPAEEFALVIESASNNETSESIPMFESYRLP